MLGVWLIAPLDPRSLKAIIATKAKTYDFVLVSIMEVLLTSSKALEKMQKMNKLKVRQNISGKP